MLSVKAVTLIFISWRGWLFHPLNKGNQVLFIIRLVLAVQTCMHFMKTHIY